MPDTRESRYEKDRTLALIERAVGATHPVIRRRRDWRVSSDGQVSAFVTFSRAEQLFYDVSPRDLEAFLKYPRSFVVFVMGDAQHALIIPSVELHGIVADLAVSTDGNVKLHVAYAGYDYTFREAPRHSLLRYFNKFVQLEPTAALLETVTLDLESLAHEEDRSEGTLTRRLTNYYERKAKLRAAAIRFHGTVCPCGFDFEAVYGRVGENFIEVHHTRPVSTLGDDASVDPKTDMIVLCANCHRMVHRKRDNPLSLDDLKRALRIIRE
jgi:hypothetical protein